MKKIGTILMKIKKIFIFLLISLFMTACDTQKYDKQESQFIVFKTATFKYADLGFIYQNKKHIKVELYSSGQVAMTLALGEDTVCMSLMACMQKESFNKEVLSKYYPKDILNHIFRGEMIFSAVNSHKTRNGFTQKLFKKDKYNIKYSVLNKQIVFRDTINDILIKIKRLSNV
jgi:hypothetical protein